MWNVLSLGARETNSSLTNEMIGDVNVFIFGSQTLLKKGMTL